MPDPTTTVPNKEFDRMQEAIKILYAKFNDLAYEVCKLRMKVRKLTKPTQPQL